MKDKQTDKSLSGYIVGWLIATVVLWLPVAFAVEYLTGISAGAAFAFLPALLSAIVDYRVWVLWAALSIGLAAMLYLRNNYSVRRIKKINDTENSRWLTDADIRKSSNMTIVSYDKLASVKDGIPIYAKRQGGKITVVMTTPMHTLNIGSTRTGKTAGFVEPTIQILAHTKTKPSLVITDPKGELLARHGKTLEAQGYELLVVDIVDVYASAKWNPFDDIIKKTREIATVENASDAARKHIKLIEPKNGRYIFDGEVFDTYSAAENAKRVFRDRITDEVFSDLKDIVDTLCPAEKSSDPSWQQGARDFIFGLTLAMWEDLRDGECRENEFNLFTLYKNIQKYANGDMSELAAYFDHRGPDSRASGLAATVLVSEDRTRTSYLSEVNRLMTWLADNGVCAMTSENDLDLSGFDERPTALFIKIPDEKENRHRLVTLMLTQMYKILVGKARKNKSSGLPDAKLKRNVYFIMDEFGNLPKFPTIKNIVTVGAGRGIYLVPIIQDYNQLDNIYGKDIAGIVKSNCNIKTFIGTTDPSTMREFSELCGKTKKAKVSFTDRTVDALNVSVNAEAQPLVYPSELEHLNDPPEKIGNTIVLVQGKYPLKSKFEPVFSSRDIYKPEKDEYVLERASVPFDADAHFFDFSARNAGAEETARRRDDAQKDRELIASLVDIEEPTAEIPTDPFDKIEDVIQFRIDNIKRWLPDGLGADFDDALNERDLDELVRLCDKALDIAHARRDNFLLSDVAKLKVYITRHAYAAVRERS